eukprot:6191162-Ditylum_brightwellii.AAC.1
MEVPKVNDTLEESPPNTLKVSRVGEKGGQESKDNVEDDHDGLEVHGKDDNVASSLPESDEEGNKMEVEMEVEVPKVNDTSEVFPPDTLKVLHCDELKVSQSKCHAKGGKQMAKLEVAKGR